MMTMTNQMGIYSRAGTRVQYTGEGGYPHHKEHANKFLTAGTVYTVERTDVGDWHTNVFLKEFPGEGFNSVMFAMESFSTPKADSKDTIRKIETLRRWSETSVKLDAGYLAEIADEMERIYNEMIARSGLPWRPIAELDDKYGDENGFLLLAPELVDEDCNIHGVGMGHYQDDGLLWHASQSSCDESDPDKDYGSWMACKWSMTNDEWSHVCCTPTHYIRLRGVEQS